ncbi:MAG: isoleucine--tRNA ligase [Prevotellaceae bacterium]|jgi:isoleucyl-tRNA synthetase|nr:isoleucine--tRNA ligase [Prevotellaceae bacterium]
MKFKEYKNLNLTQINNDILKKWDAENTFAQSIETRKGCPVFTFYEGPPSANGVPGIHHVMARAIKDIFCRYKTQKGFLVKRKAGWDTHGLPVELGVEKMLGITKEDIGKKISVDEYNNACRKEVMKYTELWEKLTRQMGYWIDMSKPYITYDNDYIETLWFLLKDLYNKDLLYKGYTIQPYSPAAGTGLSTHELNQPGCYRDVKDTTVTAQFKIKLDELLKGNFLKMLSFALSEKINNPTEKENNIENLDEYEGLIPDIYFLAWTTTPWTLPSNTALCVGKKITYCAVSSENPYTQKKCVYIIAKDLVSKYFNEKIPFEIIGECIGEDLIDIRYEQLIKWINPRGDAFRVISGDYVTTDDGTGIVHIAPTFGADDAKVAKAANIPALHLIDKNGNIQPMVDRTGKFFNIEDLDADFVEKYVDDSYKQYAGRFVKNDYDKNLTEKDTTLDIDLCVMLKQENKAFKIEKYVHTYPHCWRTDKPVIYYPLDSWFIKTTALKDTMVELNRTIKWKPESTGTGRFEKWLENLQDWNLSRTRYWGTPLPIWRTADGSEQKCIGSIEELYNEAEKSVLAGLMKENPYKTKGFTIGDFSKENYKKIDLHRPYIDDIILVSEKGEPMKRELDLIDVWFDSGAMPFAQQHYMGENLEAFPADFIAEGVDQTRGWFFTLHAISTMVKGSVSFKNVISNGLVLDKNGNKMSKRLGNAIEPFAVMDEYGSDTLRWYMITNSQPWDNLKFDIAGVDEVKRKFFGTLYNTYSFFALYANVDDYKGNEPEIPINERPEIDVWIISLLNSLVKEVENAYENYEPTRAGRAIQDFVLDNLSNWYVRLNRKRFWGGKMNADKLAAYQTLQKCLETVALLAAPIAPFFCDNLFCDLNEISCRYAEKSVHLAKFPAYDETLINNNLEEKMNLAQQVCSMVLALRRKANKKVRQPLMKIMIPVSDADMKNNLDAVKHLILGEVNVKELEFLDDTTGIIIKKIKPNFKTLGKIYGKQMKEISAALSAFSQQDISNLETQTTQTLNLPSGDVNLTIQDVEITSEDIPGWLVATEGKLTIALDITITPELFDEGIAREIVNRIQNIRKNSNFDVTDKISIQIEKNNTVINAVNSFYDYISTQTLAAKISFEDSIEDGNILDLDDMSVKAKIEKITPAF